MNEFGTYSVDIGGRLQRILLQTCSSCGAHLTVDGIEVPSERIVERIQSSKAKMRTITMQVNSGVYEKLEDLVRHETGGKDTSKIMNEILALGLKQYKHTLS